MHLLSKSRMVLAFLISCFLLLSGISTYCLAADRHLKLGVFIMDPMVTRDDDGNYHGAVVEIARHIAGLEGWELEIFQCDFHECLAMLESGELDLASPVAFTEKRAEKYSYNRETLLMDWGQIYADRDQHISNIMDLQGKRVVSLNRTVFNDTFIGLLNSFDISIERLNVSDYLDVFRYVEDGRADAMVLNRMFGEKNISMFDNVEKTPIIFMPIDIRFATPKGRHMDIRDALDRRLKELKADPFSEYYKAMDRMLGAKPHGYHLPHWVKWAVTGTLGLLVFMFVLSMVFRHQVNQRTTELRHENEERRRAERNLFESRESFKTLVEFTAAIHWELDLKSRKFTYVSPQAVSMLGYPADAWVDLDFWKRLLYLEDRDWAYEFCMEEARKGNDHELVYRAVDSEGRTVWLRDIVKVIMGAGGPEKLIGIMFDITKQKQVEESMEASLKEKEVLLKEIHHRVKNNMAIISSLSSLQSRHLKDEGAIRILKEGRDRIRAMALVHEQLYQSENLSDISVKQYLDRLVDNVARSYTVMDRDKIRVECDDLRLSVDTLVPCGLIINELLTNALKYAYEVPGSGEIVVSMKHNRDSGCTLMVRDWGKGLPPDVSLDSHRSLGLQLVSTLARQLEGELEISTSGGVAVEIFFSSENCLDR